MCMGSTPKAPEPADVLPEAAVVPDVAAESATSNATSANADKRRKNSATLLTGPRGLTDDATTKSNTLLGG